MDTKHTATPWAVTVGGVITSGDDLLSGIKLISPWIEDAWDNDPEALANSSLIVRAVNAHDRYVLALVKIAGMDLRADEMAKLAQEALKDAD